VIGVHLLGLVIKDKLDQQFSTSGASKLVRIGILYCYFKIFKDYFKNILIYVCIQNKK